MVSQMLRAPRLLLLLLTVLLVALSSVGVSAGYVEGHKHRRMRSSVHEAREGRGAAKQLQEAEEEDDEDEGDDDRIDEESFVQTDSDEGSDDEAADDAEADAEAEADEDAEAEEAEAARKRQQRVQHKRKDGPDEVNPFANAVKVRKDSVGKALALDDTGKVHNVDFGDSTMNSDQHHLDYENKNSNFDRLSTVLGYGGARVGVDTKGNIRHEFKDFTQADWYPVTKEITSALPNQISELQTALKKQHSSAQDAYSESVKYRNLIRDLMSELTHYQEGEHKFRDQVFSREDERSEKIKNSLQFKPSDSDESPSPFNDRSRETADEHDKYMQAALARQRPQENAESLMQTDEVEAPVRGGSSFLQEGDGEYYDESYAQN